MFFKLKIVGKMGCFKYSIQILDAKVIKIYESCATTFKQEIKRQ